MGTGTGAALAPETDGQVVRLLPCPLPIKSPWLNPIEPKWLHSKKRVVEAARILSTDELAERVCASFSCPHYPHLLAPLKEVPLKLAAKKSARPPRTSNLAA